MRLAIVEDDDKVRQQLQTYVLQYFQGRENDVEIRLFADGDEILEDYAADYDLIFLDIQMKRLDGLATAERIRERDEDVYLVFITNLANYAIRGYAVHALDFILKPVNFLMLRQVLMSVERLLEQKPKRYITLPTDTGLTRLDVRRGGLAVRQPLRHVQPLHKRAAGKIPRSLVPHALQHEHVLCHVGRDEAE